MHRWSELFIPTLREAPADAEVASHKLLVRAGYIRQLGAGIYSFLFLGNRTTQKIISIVRQEMDKIGQEFYLPTLHPRELWEASGRWTVMGENMFRLKDRKGADLCLGMTHEEVMTDIARKELRSYKQLPQIWYQIQTKFRDEPRPKSGLLRVRQFIMKDAYSFDMDAAGLDVSYLKNYDAYCRIFDRCGLKYMVVEAHSGAMGGSQSHEFMVRTPAGEDQIVSCEKCSYAANLEKATSKLAAVEDLQARGRRQAAAGPHARQGRDRRCGGVPEGFRQERHQDRRLHGANARRGTGKTAGAAGGRLPARRSHGERDQAAHPGQGQQSSPHANRRTGEVLPGSRGIPRARRPGGEVEGDLGVWDPKQPAGDPRAVTVVLDEGLVGRANLICGANKLDYHLKNVTPGKDFQYTVAADVRSVNAGEDCPNCGAALRIETAVEVGHIFKLGYKYSESMGARVLDRHGKEVAPIMGSYGIGIERILTAAVEQSNDDNGFWLPPSIAPFEVVVVPTNTATTSCAPPPRRSPGSSKPSAATFCWTTATNAPGSSSKTRTWWVSPLGSMWGRRLPKILWKSFSARLGNPPTLRFPA